MQPFQVSQIQTDKADANGVNVLMIYARFIPRYAVYQTSERVTIQFHDDPLKESEQREKMVRLSPLRGEINGLVDGWRTDCRESFQKTARRYDRRVADALIVALEGDVESGLQILQQIRDDVVAERKSYARFLYLICAAITAVVLCSIAIAFAHHPPSNQETPGPFTFNTWLALGAGTLGAFFSIARGISSRSIHTDLQKLDNFIDAILRVVIGTIAAVVLQALLDAQLFSLNLGNAVLGATEHIEGLQPVVFTSPLVLLVAAFIAGFSERLIPDLLGTATMTANDKPQSAPTPLKPNEADVKKPLGEPTTAKPSGVDAAPLGGAHDHEDMVDGCDVDVASSNVPPTPDDRLPAASGGVAKSS